MSDSPPKASAATSQTVKRTIVIVSDTSPINYLLLCGALEVLPKLYGRIIIPRSVHAELASRDAPEIVRRWARSPPSWVAVCSATHIDLSLPLDPGECEAICLAEELHADGLIVDDAEARGIARARGLIITGTLGVLELAASRGLVQLSEAFIKLRHTTFHISEDLLQRALARDALRRGRARRDGKKG